MLMSFVAFLWFMVHSEEFLMHFGVFLMHFDDLLMHSVALMMHFSGFCCICAINLTCRGPKKCDFCLQKSIFFYNRILPRIIWCTFV